MRAASVAGRTPVRGPRGNRLPLNRGGPSRIVTEFGPRLAAASRVSPGAVRAVFEDAMDAVRTTPEGHIRTLGTRQNYLSIIRSEARRQGAEMNGEPMTAWRLTPGQIHDLNNAYPDSRRARYNAFRDAHPGRPRAGPWRDIRDVAGAPDDGGDDGDDGPAHPAAAAAAAPAHRRRRDEVERLSPKKRPRVDGPRTRAQLSRLRSGKQHGTGKKRRGVKRTRTAIAA